VVHEEVDPESVRSGFDGVPPTRVREQPGAPAAGDERLVWEQRVMAALPERLQHDDESLDEVRLEGTWNNDLTIAQRAALLKETVRVFKPQGQVHVHGLVADGPFPGGPPALPGVAALVRRVPLETEPIEELTAAGFIAIHVTKLPESPAFVHDG